VADRVWNLREQIEIARKSFAERPDWVKSISHFAGTNNVCAACGGGGMVPSGDPEFPMQPCECVKTRLQPRTVEEPDRG
jgi:hypothetical protein